MTDLGAWATEQYRIPGSTLATPTSFPDLLDGNDDTEEKENG
jgi:endogenous inhibitor of DNA gyrase (YacG/DUF329 family)